VAFSPLRNHTTAHLGGYPFIREEEAPGLENLEDLRIHLCQFVSCERQPASKAKNKKKTIGKKPR
jgi:hypothetical protein